jgi:hypothetical protein
MISSGATTMDAAPASGGTVPFWFGSNIYVRRFSTFTAQLGAAQNPQVFNVPPQGYLGCVRAEVRSTGGVGGVVGADGAWLVMPSIELDDIDGGNILYPMPAYSHQIAESYSKPWNGDLTRRFDYSPSVNPSFSLPLRPEIRHTAGVLANTDARSQYKVQYTLNTWAGVITGGTTAPTVTVGLYLEVWAQPDGKDLSNNSIAAEPPGLNLQVKRRHQVLTLNAAGADNTLQTNLTGNEIRCPILIVRDSNNARQDYLSDPIQWQLDNKNLGQFSPNETFNLMNDFYEFLNNGTSARPAGVYVWPRFYQPGTLVGQAWLATTNATFLQWETTTLATGINLPGTVELLFDEVIPIGPIPMELESI